jgi:hypothetical protein
MAAIISQALVAFYAEGVIAGARFDDFGKAHLSGRG